MPFLYLSLGFTEFIPVFGLLQLKKERKGLSGLSIDIYTKISSGTIEGMKSKPISIDLLSTPISKLIKPTMMALVYLKARASEIALLRNRQ